MQMSRLSLPLAAVLVAGCAHTAGNARTDLPPAPVIAPASIAPASTARALPPAPSLSEAPVPAPVNTPRVVRSATR